jgi:predicted aminopeptidase
MSIVRLVALLLAAGLVAGCGELRYYAQSIQGHLDVMSKRQPIVGLLESPETPEELRHKLERVVLIREFAHRELQLPDNDSYRSYADVGRRFVVWNVVAAPEFSLQPRQWCFPVAGCVSYRGYFSEERARAYAERLHEQGYDVYVGGVQAYSTLGWFDDPLLNTMLARSEADLAGVIFHELAHQQLYIQDDTIFNESFAVAVEREGVRRWLAQHGAPGAVQHYLAAKQRQDEFVALVLGARERLETLYRSELPEEAMRREKARAFEQLVRDYAALRDARWGGNRQYDGWFARDLNNARLATIAAYYKYVPAFEQLIEESGGDLGRFYAAARGIGELPRPRRRAELETLLAAASAEADPQASRITGESPNP